AEQVAGHQGQHHLGFRVAKAAVVLDHLGPVLGEHQPKVQASLKGAALLGHGPDGGQEDLLHAPLGDLRGIQGIGAMVPMPPVFRPVSPSPARLWSMLDTMGLTVLPSVKASTDTSGPWRNSSTTTRLPLSPKRLSTIMA